MLKLKVKQVIYESRYNDNIKRPKPQDTQLGILKITYIKVNNRSGGPIWNYANPDILERVLNRIALSNSTAGKCTPMPVIKQPEHWRSSATGTNMIILSDKLWLTVNNSQSFTNGSKSKIRNHLVCASILKFTLFRTFKNIVIDLMT